MPYPLPVVIVNGVTPDHNIHAADLNDDWNKRYLNRTYVGPPAAGASVGKDKAAVSAAHAAVAASATGGAVSLGPGIYQVGDLRLTWPGPTKVVTIEGAGELATVLWFETDGAAGEFAMGGVGGYSVHLRNMTVAGPGTSFTLGTAPCNLRAMQLDSRAHIENVQIWNFHTGMQIVGDHITLDHVKVQNCFYGIYCADAITGGDNTATDVDLTGNMRASLACHPNSGINGWTFLRGHFGYTPFGIEFEAGGTGWSGMTDTQFIGTAWEYCGNGMIYNADREVIAYNIEISGARPWTGNATFKIAALAVQPDVFMGQLANWNLIGDGPTDWDCIAIRQSRWDGWRLAYDRAVSQGKTFLKANMGYGGVGGTFALNNSNSRAVAMNVTAAVTVGQVVEYTGARHYVRPHNPSGANGGSMVAGVAMTAATSGTDVCIVAVEDYEGVPVKVAGAGPYGANDMLFAVGTAGAVDNVAGAGTYANKAIIGRVGDTLAVSSGKLNGVIVKVTDRAT